MNKLFLIFLILGLLALACAATSLVTPGDYVKEFGGNINVFTRILDMTDCTELQREFERAEEAAKQQEPGTEEHKASIGYRTAAENRMKEVECSGDL
jgi:hypothetical protein